ncbi:MAG: AAA family ATPase, partial [Halobacteriota archaeon]
YQEYAERYSDERDSLERQIEELQTERGGVESEIERLERLRDEVDVHGSKRDAAESLYEDVENLEEAYASLRSELRLQNVRRLAALLDEMFDTMYASDSYSGVELDEDYGLHVYEKDGTELDPSYLSGGERAVFNISLRCAIYRLLVEGVDGERSPLPPLMLDEPTVFLDSEHVSRLIRLVRAMNEEYGVEQVVVVSHDVELLDAADHRLAVDKDSTTNRSTVHAADALAGGQT